MSPPLLVTMKVAVLVLTLLHEPATARSAGAGGVFVGVLVGVLVGRSKQEPVTFKVTEERKDVR